MFNERDIIEVLNELNTYDRDRWYFTLHNIEYLESCFQRDKLPNKTSKYIIKYVNKNKDSCVIQDLRTQQVFIVKNDEETLRLVIL